MKNKLIYFINGGLILIISILNFFYQYNDFHFGLKCLTSSVFVIMGIINFIYLIKFKKSNFLLPLIVLVGLIFALLGDALINEFFILGAASFALGHIAFLISYFKSGKTNLIDIIICTLLLSLSVLIITNAPILVFEDKILHVVIIIYAVIISVMLGKAISNFIHVRNLHNLILMVASILFYISDFFLLIAWFSTIEGIWTSNICMATYYPALSLIALSLIIKNKENPAE